MNRFQMGRSFSVLFLDTFLFTKPSRLVLAAAVDGNGIVVQLNVNCPRRVVVDVIHRPVGRWQEHIPVQVFGRSRARVLRGLRQGRQREGIGRQREESEWKRISWEQYKGFLTTMDTKQIFSVREW